MRLIRIIAVLMLTSMLLGCAPQAEPVPTVYSAGFGSCVLTVQDPQLYYIAGYHNGEHPAGQLDPLQVNALWLDDGATSLLLLSVDCVGLDSGTVQAIRQELSDFSRRTGCDSINVISTHTHAGVDTLGLWGPVGINGKNREFMEELRTACLESANAAYNDRTTGQLLYSVTPTQGLQHDSREPAVYDKNLYQLRFVPTDPDQNGIRLISFAAHAEALRGDNRLISADYPGVVRRLVREETGDDLLFVPGAIGGLIMTPEFDESNALSNLEETGRRITQYVLHPATETPLDPGLYIVRQEFTTGLDNTLFIYYKFLGILGNNVRKTSDGYRVRTELTLVTLGNVTLALLPGELFPELVEGTGNPADPEGLNTIASRHGVENLVIVGLANDELGYILPPSVFALSNEAPYIQHEKGHYEETNSVGPQCASDLAKAFENVLQK